MGIHTHGGTPTGAVTPICNSCGISLCWDISRTEYLEAAKFWDDWNCEECNGSRLSAYSWSLNHGEAALPHDVRSLVEAFTQAHPELQDTSADNDSLVFSTSFADALAAANIPHTIGMADYLAGPTHIAVQFGDFTIDWCGLDYDEYAPVPLIYKTAHGWPLRGALIAAIREQFPKISEAALEKVLSHSC